METIPFPCGVFSWVPQWHVAGGGPPGLSPAFFLHEGRGKKGRLCRQREPWGIVFKGEPSPLLQHKGLGSWGEVWRPG